MAAPLVGRDLDLAVCLEQLKRAEGGAAVALLVRGEAGIGKSRLVGEVVARAGGLGYAAAVGRADDLDQGIPFAAFRDLLARLTIAADETSGLRDALDSGADAEGEHLPAVFAAAVRLCRALAADAPAVLVLEDLHVADRESLALAALLARLSDVALLTIFTLRPGTSTDIERLLEEMATEGRAAVIDLEPLDRPDTQALVAAVLGSTPDDATVDAVFTASHGNPFFAQEVALSIVEGGTSARPGGPLLRRLFGASAVDVELAKVMAVFGKFSLRHLPVASRLVGRTDDETASAFDRLVKAGLLVESTGGGYEFTHSIVRSTLYDDIGPAERRRVHAAIAAELATERRAGIVLDVLELATHIAESAEPGDEAAAAVLLDAAHAVAATAPLVSAGYFRRAADLMPERSPARASALAAQARALHRGSRPAESAAVGLAALAALPADSERRSATAAFVANDLYLTGAAAGALAVLDAELLQGGDTCPLLAMRVNVQMQADHIADAAADFDAAVTLLDGPPASVLMALSHLIQYANHVGRIDVAAALLDRLDTLAAGASPAVQVAAHELAAFADWRPGLAARLATRIEAARQLRPDTAAMSIGGTLEISAIRLHYLRGEWDAALDSIGRASFDLDQRGAITSAQLLLYIACQILVDQGALDEAAAVAERFVTPIMTLRRNAALARARLHHALGDLDQAAATLEPERDAAGAPGASIWLMDQVLGELATVYAERGRVDEAAVLVEEVDAVAARLGWPESRAAALRARATVHRDPAAAQAALEHAIDESWEVERAHAELLLGELDVDAAVNLTSAYRRFDSFSAAPWRRRAAAGLRSRGLTVPRRVAQSRAGLTETEVQLVRLVRDGLSNRQIATAMHYSPKTIEVYLGRVYAKTGCASRLELIRAVDTGTVDV